MVYNTFHLDYKANRQKSRLKVRICVGKKPTFLKVTCHLKG